LIKKGAEASLYESSEYKTYCEGKVVEKIRVPKRYRSNILDQRLTDERIKTEAKLMADARTRGIAIPIIYDIDLVKKKIVMEHIEGKMVKDILNSEYKGKNALCQKIGTSIGILHRNDIIHGDLTTSNMILSKGNLYFIDFSLGFKSKEIEHKGVDLHLLHEAFKSSHPENFSLFRSVLKAYRSAYPHALQVEKKMVEIEKRGRYT